MRARSAACNAWWTRSSTASTSSPQVSAATKALEGVALLLLDQHLEHCLTHATDAAEAQQKLNEASAAIRRLVRS